MGATSGAERRLGKPGKTRRMRRKNQQTFRYTRRPEGPQRKSCQKDARGDFLSTLRPHLCYVPRFPTEGTALPPGKAPTPGMGAPSVCLSTQDVRKSPTDRAFAKNHPCRLDGRGV